MRLALAQLNFTVGAFEANFARIADAVSRASAQGADLVVFTELAATGYPPRDWVSHEAFVDKNLALVERVAALSTEKMGILIGFVDRHQSPAAAAPERRGVLPARTYRDPAPQVAPAHLTCRRRPLLSRPAVEPIEIHGVRVGVSIREDVWNDEDFWPTRRYHRDPIAE